MQTAVVAKSIGIRLLYSNFYYAYLSHLTGMG